MTDATRDRWMPRSGVVLRRHRATAAAEQEFRQAAAIERGERRKPRDLVDCYKPEQMPGSLTTERGFR